MQYMSKYKCQNCHIKIFPGMPQARKKLFHLISAVFDKLKSIGIGRRISLYIKQQGKMQDFETKRKNLFACLDAIADQSLKGTILDQSEIEKDTIEPRKRFKKSKTEDLNTSKLRGKESLFKKPYLPLAKCLKPRTTPDYKKNPHKWTKYSLEDADISDQMNTRAAFDFLKNLENKKEEANNDDDDEQLSKVVFSKSASIKRSLRDETVHDTIDQGKPILKGSKLVMPEYIVGKKQPKDKKNRNFRKETKNTGKELTLSHLLDNDEVDEDI